MTQLTRSIRLHPDIWLLALAAVLLLAQSLMHLMAYAGLDEGLQAMAALSMERRLPSFDVLRGAWLLYAVHLGVAALLCAGCAVTPALFGRGLRIVLAAWMAADTVLLLWFVGLFIGSVLMALAALALVAAAFWPMPEASSR